MNPKGLQDMSDDKKIEKYDLVSGTVESAKPRKKNIPEQKFESEAVKNFRIDLEKKLKHSLEFSDITNSSLSIKSFVSTFDNPCYVLEIKGGNQLKGLIHFEKDLVNMLLHYFLGGSESSFHRVAHKELTLLDEKTLLKGMEAGLKEISSYFQLSFPQKFTFNPQFITYTNPNEKYSVLEYEVMVEGAGGQLTFAFSESLFKS
jgi:flagellar motor switch protein FliM